MRITIAYSAVLAVLVTVSMAAAAPIIETELNGQATNNSQATAQSIPAGAFTLPVPATVYNPPGYTTATISGRGGGSDLDYYRFSANGGQVILDIDDDPFVYDSMLFLFDAAGNLLAFNDDMFPEDPGTAYGYDAFLGVYTLPGPGDYFIAVSTYPNGVPDVSLATFLARPDGGFGGFAFTQGETTSFNSGNQDGSPYTLHVSLQNPADLTVPEPASMAIWGLGSLGLAWAARRRRMKNKAAA